MSADEPAREDVWALDVIETLIRATDDNGLKVCLGYEARDRILRRALEFNQTMDADMKPGGGFHDFMMGLAKEGNADVR